MLALLGLGIVACSLLVQGDQQVTSHDLDVSRFAIHPSLPRLYASLPDSDTVAVIDTQTLELLATPVVGPDPVGLALSPDGATLWVATSGATRIVGLDTQTLLPAQAIDLPTPPYDIELGNNGRAFVTPLHWTTGIMQVDTLAGQVLGDFSLGVLVYKKGMLEISPDRNTLYFGNSGLSGAQLAVFDVSSDTPSLITKLHGTAIGSDGEDLELANDGSFLSYVCGSGNHTYDIFKISTSNFVVEGSFITGAYPREIAFDPKGTRAHVVHAVDHIDVFSTQTYLPLREIPTVGQVEELELDASGRFLFAALASSLVVWELEEAVGQVYCSGSNALCPCGNSSGPVQGCVNGAGGGGQLLGSGSESLVADDLVLDAAFLPPSTSAVLLISTTSATPLTLGNGSLCMGGAVTRLAWGASDDAGDLRFGPGLGLSDHFGDGQTGHAQVWYRDTSGPCAANSNLTNGLRLEFSP